MTDFPEPFNTGDTLTADYFNQMIADQLQRLQANNFDLLNQQGNITAYTYSVPADKDQILQLNSYLDMLVAEPSGVNVIVNFTRISGDVFRQTLNGGGNLDIENNIGFNPGQTFVIKAKRGTDVIITVQAVGEGTYDTGGSVVVIKSIA
jgi:hypothetical protein